MGAAGDSSFVRSIIDGLRFISVIVEVFVVEGKLIGDSAVLTGLLKSRPSPLHRVGLCNGGSVMAFDRWLDGPSFTECGFMKVKGEDMERLRSCESESNSS